MKKTSIALFSAVLVVCAAVSFAQPPGITPDMINTTLPLEGAPLAVAGPYNVTSEPAFGAPGHVVFRPADLAPFPTKDKLPVLVWGNGGCSINSTRYSGFFTTIASHGFLVLSTVPVPGAARRQQNADDMRAEIDWAAAENARDGSPLKGKIAVDQVSVMGQSCGGFLSVALGTDPRVRTIGVFNSGVQKATPGRAAEAARTRADHQRRRTRFHDADVARDVSDDRPRARVLRRTPRRRPHGDRRSSGRRRICQRRVELADVDLQERQEGRRHVRRQELRPLHERQLGRAGERDQRVNWP
jgi:acetyl esterase/lipase